MTTAQLAAASGALLALGIVLAVWRLIPADPDLGDVMARLAPTQRRRGTPAPEAPADSTHRIGAWAWRHLPPHVWGRTPARELALLRIPTARFYGEKIAFAAVGLMLPVVIGVVFSLIGLTLPLTIPVVASLVVAGVLWFVPNLNAHTSARRARVEFSRALGAFIDLVALERNHGSGPRQAMEVAATVGDSWVFHRIAEELARSRWSGVAPWDALHGLADELGLPDLNDLADIMRLSGEEGAQVYATLRARSAAMRTAMLTTEQGKANEISERMVMPGSLLGIVFIAILIVPSLLRLLPS